MTRGKRLFQLGARTREDSEREMRDELAHHLEARTAQLISQGIDAEVARAEASRRLGITAGALLPSAVRRDSRLRTKRWLDDFAGDVRYALRGLRRQPLFASVAILTIAFGIGANTAIYSAVDTLLVRALPFQRPDRLMDVVLSSPEGGASSWSWPKYAFFRDAQRSFALTALHTGSQAVATGAEPERLTIEEVGGAYLRTLGVPVALGRDFPIDVDKGPGAPRLAVLSDEIWQRRFNGRPDIVGQTFVLDNIPWEIIGVLPPGFRGLTGKASALLNLSARSAEELNQAWSLEFNLIGRLRDDVPAATASSEAQQLGPRIYEAYPMQDGAISSSARPDAWSADARALNTIRVASGLKRSLLVLFGAVALVLLIACVNLASLLVSRGAARAQEFALRSALGAGRGRMLRLSLAESLTIAFLGGAASLGVAWLGVRGMSALNPREALRVQGLEGGIGAIGLEQITLDARAFWFALGVTLLVGLAFGLAPALRAAGQDVNATLKEGTLGARDRRWRLGQRSLVLTEVALAVVLLAGSGLMIRSLGNLLNVDPGFDARRVLTLRLSVVPDVVARDSMPGFYEEVEQSLAAIPGVKSVALTDCPPLNNGCNGTLMTFPDKPQQAESNAMIGVHWMTPSWLKTMGVPLRRGRGFEASDRIGTPRVVLINESAARRYFPGENPIGKRVAIWQGGFDKGAEVVGVVGDVKFATIDSAASPDAFLPYAQSPASRMMIFLKTESDPLALIAPVRLALRRVAPAFPVYDVRTMESRVGTAGGQARFAAGVLGLFAAVALALAIMGIYGVTSFAVTRRTREIGIRVALGADRAGIAGMVIREVLLLALLGLGVGLVAAMALTRVLRFMLFEVSTTDPVTYFTLTVVLLFTALAAGFVPARRAARFDAIAALKTS